MCIGPVGIGKGEQWLFVRSTTHIHPEAQHSRHQLQSLSQRYTTLYIAVHIESNCVHLCGAQLTHTAFSIVNPCRHCARLFADELW